MPANFSEIAFTPSVQAQQERLGSRKAMQRFAGIERRVAIDGDLAQFVQARDSFYLGTASADGRPYIQHRGGPPGFLKVRDQHTLAFADFGGNRQYITLGNLAENDRAFIFLMDYANRRRIIPSLCERPIATTKLLAGLHGGLFVYDRTYDEDGTYWRSTMFCLADRDAVIHEVEAEDY